MATENPENAKHTPWRKFRLPTPLWEAYGSICARVLGRERSEDLVEHVRSLVAEHGNAEELAKLKQAAQELEERRARKGGRPRKTPPAAE
ncbi:hypothetical protein ABZ897_00635 [Nonomuraea sp. NPDC046802]|uniref:hypothetical protein n=1 Tax=Nonomuraea sp. NPDC046802 TaxID=3154919 RepID=UPI003401C4C4